jgi:hypothetical protein
MAIEYNCSDTVVLTLLAGNKKATMVSIGSGHLPLHLAIKYKRSDTVALALIAEIDDASKRIPLKPSFLNKLSSLYLEQMAVLLNKSIILR